MTFTALQEHYSCIKTRKIVDLFAENKQRFEQFSCSFDGLLFDYSKTNIDLQTRTLLFNALETANLDTKRNALFQGAIVNQSEQRAALHHTLRVPISANHAFAAEAVQQAHTTLHHMAALCDQIRSGHIAHNNQPYNAVINIGIGGSDLGPMMAYRALSPYHLDKQQGQRPIPVRFLSNIDGADCADSVYGLDAKRTLIIVASKSFSTLETIKNAKSIQNWMRANGVRNPLEHFIAITSKPDKARAFGIADKRILRFDNAVGGRYSLWGAVGLSIMLAIGEHHFGALLAGGHAIDQHFQTAPPLNNIPILMAVIGLWHNQICDYSSRAILPYEQRLQHLPSYLQQLEMESNGKSTTQNGKPIKCHSSPIIWGGHGSNGQHSFFQFLHQGSRIVPAEFLLGVHGLEAELETTHHRALIAHCLAQSDTLLEGRALDKNLNAAPHRVFAGNRPSTTLLYPQLTPYVLGQLVALYEHRVFTEGVLANINSFDQWGVELGKQTADTILDFLNGTTSAHINNPSTRGLLHYIVHQQTDNKTA